MAKKSSKDDSSIRPLGDRVLVAPVDDAAETTSPSGIILPDSGSEDKKDRGTVIAVGPGRRGDDNELIPVSVAKGDTVIFQWGDKITYQGKEYFLVAEGNILAVIG